MAIAPLNTCTVKGAILDPSGKPIKGFMVFTLKPDDQIDGDITVNSGPYEYTIPEDGNISVDLWPTPFNGIYDIYYEVKILTGTRQGQLELLDRFKISVPDQDEAVLNDTIYS